MPGSELPPRVPSTRNVFSRTLGRLLMRAAGWRFAGTFPDEPKFVALLAPHTSNWDFFVALSAKWALDLDVVWLGKDTLFRWPVAGFLRRVGGISIDRTNAHGIVSQIVSAFAARERIVLVLTPEGTRRRVEHWRSGYWHVAHQARVPIVPIGLDYGLRTVFLGPPVMTTDSLESDEKRLRSFYAGIRARRPENYVA